MKTIVLNVKKVVSQKANGMPEIEETTIKISPEATINKYIKLIPNQNFASVEVIKVLDKGKEVNEIEKYQALIDDTMEGSKQEKPIDYKALTEKQADLIKNMEQRLAALENNSSESGNSEDRLKLESKAKELNITFRSTIGDDNLLKKIQEIEPEYNI